MLLCHGRVAAGCVVFFRGCVDICHYGRVLVAPLVGGLCLLSCFAWRLPRCYSGISRCHIQLSWILSLCSSCVVSVNWCSSVLVLVVFGFVTGIECCMVLTVLVGPGSVCIGCPLVSLRWDCGVSH